MNKVQRELVRCLIPQDRIPTPREYDILLTRMEQGIEMQSFCVCMTGLKLDYEYMLLIENGEQKLN